LSNIISQHLREFLDTTSRPDGIGYPVAVVPCTTLEEVFVKFEVSGVHRVYIVNEEGIAIGVISTKDIVRILLTEGDGEIKEKSNSEAVRKSIPNSEQSESSPKGKRTVHEEHLQATS
jgi:CBS domain-containing protein